LQFVLDDPLHLRLETQAAESFGIIHPREAAIKLRSAERNALVAPGVRVDLGK
jgi:hypothetical protein